MKGRVWYTHIQYTCIMKPMQFAEHMQITIDTGYFSCWWKFYIASDQFLWKIYYPILRIFLWETWNVIDIKGYKLLIYTNGCNFHVLRYGVAIGNKSDVRERAMLNKASEHQNITSHIKS